MPDHAPVIPGSPTQSDTELYGSLLQQPIEALQARAASRCEQKEIILVRGFLTDALDRVGIMMADQVRATKALGCPVRKVGAPFDSENPPDVNAMVIADMLQTADLPVILITHSKGSVDTLTTLLNYPKLRGKVAGWVSIQGAVQGSPVADFVAGPPVPPSNVFETARRAALKAAFNLVFSGSVTALDAIRTWDRVDDLKRRSDDVKALVAKIPTVAFGSAAPTTRSGLRQGTDLFFRAEPRNDGLVSVERTVIPGARIVHDLDGPDHADAVTDVPGPQNWDRTRLTYTLLNLLP